MPESAIAALRAGTANTLYYTLSTIADAVGSVRVDGCIRLIQVAVHGH
jgi:hypothetical protein